LPKRARRGQTVPVKLTVGRRGDGRRRLSFSMRIPRDMPLGHQTIALHGVGGGGSEEALVQAFVDALTGDGGGRGPEPHSIRDLATRVAALHRDLGIEARFHRGSRKLVYKSGDVSFEGRVKVSLRILRRAHR
jgi:hypothetical protein